MKKVLLKILDVIKIILLILLVLFVIATAYQKVIPNNPSVFGFRTYSIITNSMYPKLKKGDVILIKEQKISDYKVGDIVTITSVIGTVGGGESYDNCSTGAHLHFGILKGWSGYTYYNPRNYIKFPRLGSRFTTRFY